MMAENQALRAQLAATPTPKRRVSRRRR
jgi:hypothetical protein